MGNRQSGPHSRDAYSYNAGNELLTSTGRIIFERDNQYEYDLNGNLIKKTQTIKNKWKLITTYAYDDENRLIEVKIQKGHKIKEVSFTYDPLGRRISKTVGRADFEDEDEEDAENEENDKLKGKEDDKDKGKHGKPFQPRTTYYVYDDQNIIAEYDENDRLIASYIHGPNIDEPLSAEIRRDWIYYHADGLGSITSLTSHMGNVVQKYEYDSFGNMSLKPHFIKQPFTYTGREFDQETGLYYYRARYYDAKAGRFITRDPIGFKGGINKYVYVSNNPINLNDPYGLMIILPPPDLIPKIMCAYNQYLKGKGIKSANDKYKHCLTSCNMAKNCGKDIACLAGFAKEIMDLLDLNPTTHAELMDIIANLDGINCSNSSSTCEKCCECEKGYKP